MRCLKAEDFSGRVTFITGPEKHCGKTTLLNRALGLLRAAGESPAFLGVGFDGEARDSLSTIRKPRILVEAGELFVSAERYIRSSRVMPEILAVLPGSSALGRLALVRARRAGEVVLVGPERNEFAGWVIERIRGEGLARSIVVDGAINRLTQVSAFSGARFFFVLRLGPAELPKAARKVRLIAALSALPHLTLSPEFPEEGLAAAAHAADLPLPVFSLDGPLTTATVKTIPPSAATVLVEDFTKVFLDETGLAALRRDRRLAVRCPFEFGGFVTALRGISPERFSEAVGDAVPEDLFIKNPYVWEEAHGAA